MERIRLTETRVFTYLPDLTEHFYRDKGAANIMAAAEVDLDELINGKVSAEELADEDGEVSYHLEIFDDDHE